jgi:GntR family transcriptional regulator
MDVKWCTVQLWFTRQSEVSIREQLTTQLILGILCHDLAPGQRLPSTRELARRFRLHPNTVSAAYRQLKCENWVEFRHGSGVYVRESKADVESTSALQLDHLITDFFRSAQKMGIPPIGMSKKAAAAPGASTARPFRRHRT